MFKNSYQKGFLSILYSIGSKPLAIWDHKVQNGHIKRITDDEVRSVVIEIMGTNVATTYIYTPSDPKQSLSIFLPFLIMIVKNMKKYFSFEITIIDDKSINRRFRVSNFQSTTKVKPFVCTMPIGLSGGWNQIQFNLADFTRRAYGSNYVETTRMQIHANVRIRRIYFCDRLYSEDEKPQEFKLYLPLQDCAPKKSKVQTTPPAPSPARSEVGLGAKEDTVNKVSSKGGVTKANAITKKISQVGKRPSQEGKRLSQEGKRPSQEAKLVPSKTSQGGVAPAEEKAAVEVKDEEKAAIVVEEAPVEVDDANAGQEAEDEAVGEEVHGDDEVPAGDEQPAEEAL